MKNLLFLILLAEYSRSENTTASCDGLTPYNIVSPSAVGRWYLVRASRMGNDTEDKNTCGFFNTEEPCTCIGVNINSTMLPPRITEYTLQNFGYNERFNAYALTKIEINAISNDSSVFNAYVPLARVNFTIAMLGTDDYLSWISLAMCDVLKNQQGELIRLKWIITRSPLPTNETLTSASDAITQGSDHAPEDMVDVRHHGCPPTL